MRCEVVYVQVGKPDDPCVREATRQMTFEPDLEAGEVGEETLWVCDDCAQGLAGAFNLTQAAEVLTLESWLADRDITQD